VSVQGVQVLNNRDLELKSISENNLGLNSDSDLRVIGIRS
jgi:hypothetical protein